MNKKHPLNQSIQLALFGILKIIKEERNFKIHLAAALLATLLGLIVGLTSIEWAIIILLIFAILSAEVFNSAIEEICNLLRDKLNLNYQETKWIRDYSAGGSLLLAIASILIGSIIFLF